MSLFVLQSVPLDGGVHLRPTHLNWCEARLNRLAQVGGLLPVHALTVDRRNSERDEHQVCSANHTLPHGLVIADVCGGDLSRV
jgi:hypothetical protein